MECPPDPKRQRSSDPDDQMGTCGSEHPSSFATASSAYRATFNEVRNHHFTRLAAADCELLVGRFVTAPDPESLGPNLAYEERKLAWVLTGEELHALQGFNANKVADRLKFGCAQEEAVLGGTQVMRVYLLPATDAVLCEWDTFLNLIGQHYDQQVATLLEVHRSALKQIPFTEIQQTDPTFDLVALDTAYGDDRRSSPTVYAASTNRLIDARAFLHHELGLNEHADLPFTQIRTSPEATKAYMVPNRSLIGLDYQDVQL